MSEKGMINPAVNDSGDSIQEVKHINGEIHINHY